MDSETQFLIEASAMAMRIEQDGIDFYSGSAKEARDRGEKEVLGFLANEEMRHLAFFRNLNTVLKQGARMHDVPQYSGKTFTMPLMPKIFPKKSEMMGRGYSNVVEEGIKAEMRSIEFYTEASAQLSKPVAKKVFEGIIGEEKKHKELLEFQRDALAQHGIWTGMSEHANLEG